MNDYTVWKGYGKKRYHMILDEIKPIIHSYNKNILENQTTRFDFSKITLVRRYNSFYYKPDSWWLGWIYHTHYYKYKNRVSKDIPDYTFGPSYKATLTFAGMFKIYVIFIRKEQL